RWRAQSADHRPPPGPHAGAHDAKVRAPRRRSGARGRRQDCLRHHESREGRQGHPPAGRQMKADLPRPLRIPAWVPEPIARSARESYAADIHGVYARAIETFGPPEDAAECDNLAALDEVRVNYAEVVRDDLAEIVRHYRPLVSDPRMRGVWHELSRRHNGGFL